METFFGRYKNPLVLAFVLIAQFFLLAVQVRRPFPAAAAKVDQEGVRAIRYGVTAVVAPPESVLHKGGLSLRSIWSSYLDLVGVKEQNAELKQEIDQLRMEQAALAEDARQGERLQDLLAFRQNYINTTVPAQVVGTSGTDRSRVLLLDKGSEDGLKADMPVITPDGIVGRVRDVYPHAAQVLEISDPTSAAGVLLEDTRTRGILRGNTRGQPQIVNLMPDDRIKPGQLVLTSGGDQIFPRGLPVGVVDHIAPDPDNEPMVDVVLKPAANLSRLEEVLIITSTGPAPTDKARHDMTRSELIAAGARAAKEAAVEQAAADAQRASDVLAQRLPSRYDQATLYAPDATADASPATSEAEAKPLHPPAALHPDHYSPSAVPSAENLTPGQRYTPLVQGNGATERQAAKAGSGDNVNATDTSPVQANAAFSAAAAAVAAQHKAIADAKAADAARRYAALHPEAAAASASTADTGGSDTGTTTASAEPTVRYINRVNADGTVTRVPVPATTAAGTTPAVRYVTRVNADGTTSRVAVPVSNPAADTTATVHYVNRTNADGTVTRVAVPNTPAAGTTAAAVHYVNRTNADGTVTRIAVPNTSAAGTTPVVHYTERINADGTITRLPIPSTTGAASNASPGAAAVRYVNRTNADGTVTRVAVPAASVTTPGAPSIRSTTRTNPDGTLSQTPVPAGSASGATNPAGLASAAHAAAAPAARYTTRVNPDGTVTRIPIVASPSTTPAGRYMTRVNPDGTVTRVAVPSTPGAPSTRPPAGSAPTSVNPPTKVITDGPLPGASRPATTPKRKTPELVPDDGSRPPTPAPQQTPKPATPQGNL